jgi:beta-glucanase (GH16 family)
MRTHFRLVPFRFSTLVLLLCFSARPPATATARDIPPLAPNISGELLAPDTLDAARFNSDKCRVEIITIDGVKAIRAVFENGAPYPCIRFPMPAGGRDLGAFGGVRVDLTNQGDQPVRAGLRVDNAGDWEKSPWNTQITELPPGQTTPLALLFGQGNGSPPYPLDPARITGIQVFLISPAQPTPVIIRNLKAWGSPAVAADARTFSKPGERDIPVTPPGWLGRRPPVTGDWIRTLDENFDTRALDTRLWSTRYPWPGPAPGQLQRYAPENVVLSGGLARFRVEKKSGHENNDPALGTRDYTAGILQSFGKWTQRYGYFEARIRIPRVRGLWPAFWMMPDRGPAFGTGIDGGIRRDTTHGGMEIDIMEILSEWGPGRNNIAIHWDGYGAGHKSWGSSQIYFGPTPDGWHAFGLLWEPGVLAWFIDGVKKAEWTSERVSNVPHYLKLNVQLGGWATTDVDDAKLPATMDVDYVRAWQLRERMDRLK